MYSVSPEAEGDAILGVSFVLSTQYVRFILTFFALSVPLRLYSNLNLTFLVISQEEGNTILAITEPETLGLKSMHSEIPKAIPASEPGSSPSKEKSYGLRKMSPEAPVEPAASAKSFHAVEVPT